MDENNFRPAFLPPQDSRLSAMNGTVVHNPEDSFCIAIGNLIQRDVDQTAKGFNAAVWHTDAEQVSTMDIPCRQVVEGPTNCLIIKVTEGGWKMIR